MPKRFNNLDAALKLLRSPTAGPDDEAPDAPAGTALRNYQLYKSDKKAITYTRTQSSNPGSEKVIVLKPFSLPDADTTKLRTTISNRAFTNLSLFGLTEAETGIDVSLQDTDKEAAGYTPARAICRNITGTTSTTTTSKITGKSYKSKADATYTIPLGRTTVNPSWGQMKSFIFAQVTAGGITKKVSFKPEKY